MGAEGDGRGDGDDGLGEGARGWGGGDGAGRFEGSGRVDGNAGGRGERAEECDQERERGESPGEEGGEHLEGVVGFARIVYTLSTTVVKWMGMAEVRLVWGGVAGRGGAWGDG